MKNLIVNIYKTLFFFDFAVIVMYLIPNLKKLNPPFLQLWREGVSLAVMLIFTAVFTKIVEKRKMKVLFFRKTFRNFSTGFLITLLLTAVPLILMKLFRLFSITGSNSIKYKLVWLAVLLLNTVSTELLLRGYLFRLYRKYYSIITVSVVITLLYISLNIGIFKCGIIYVLNMLLFNILLCLLTEYTRSLFAAVTVHFLYNAVSSFLFSSLTISDDYPHFFNTVFKGNKYLSGGNMKLEGSILLLVITAGICAYYFIKIKKRNALPR